MYANGIYSLYMELIETSVFTKKITALLSEDSYRLFQNGLITAPCQGSLIKGGNGLRKMRWSIAGKGKRGSLRIIYYYKTVKSLIYLLYVYKKNEAEDLTDKQLEILAKAVREL